MRLPNSAHTSRPWRIHEFTRDFTVEDVWKLPTPGGPDGMEELVRQITTGPMTPNAIVRTLFSIRWKLGALLGWDKPEKGFAKRVPSLRDRLPEDLLRARGPDMRAAPFRSVYRTHDEWVAELANQTVHTLMHIGWVPDEEGDGYHAQMTALVRPNGRFGKTYMAAILPFRRVLVYPRVISTIGSRWQASAAGRPDPGQQK
ncbi:DUF2867 domain-containing protein [Streptomyces sp. JJ38]|uniref:DUF2867 domain-containing protein n=1 Tax=Streptomyces sp. JJ38 TaxID=2738128 RepID=UPI001C57D612|nr:DUF2867 domain-containing protein [Streptomyces sp. JJ38]MBW1599889.1 DUF2867 domain-containing protein [Streptomyces sp. JJ38]